jgi:hypothetical protein
MSTQSTCVDLFFVLSFSENFLIDITLLTRIIPEMMEQKPGKSKEASIRKFKNFPGS